MTRKLTELQDIECLRQIAKFLETPMSHAIASPHWPAAIRSISTRLTAPEHQQPEHWLKGETMPDDYPATLTAEPDGEMAEIEKRHALCPITATIDGPDHAWRAHLDRATLLRKLRARTQPAGVDELRKHRDSLLKDWTAIAELVGLSRDSECDLPDLVRTKLEALPQMGKAGPTRAQLLEIFSDHHHADDRINAVLALLER